MLYAVRTGRKPGLYESWAECRAQVNGYSGAEYKKVKTEEEGKAYIGIGGSTEPQREELRYGYYVDGSYNSKTEQYGYAVLIVGKNGLFQENGPTPPRFRGSNNVGSELYAAVRALEIMLEFNGKYPQVVYYDYEGIYKFINCWEARKELPKYYRMRMEDLLCRLNGDVSFIKVEAHSGDMYNSIVDTLAKQGATYDIPKGSGYDTGG